MCPVKRVYKQVERNKKDNTNLIQYSLFNDVFKLKSSFFCDHRCWEEKRILRLMFLQQEILFCSTKNKEQKKEVKPSKNLVIEGQVSK